MVETKVLLKPIFDVKQKYRSQSLFLMWWQYAQRFPMIKSDLLTELTLWSISRITMASNPYNEHWTQLFHLMHVFTLNQFSAHSGCQTPFIQHFIAFCSIRCGFRVTDGQMGIFIRFSALRLCYQQYWHPQTTAPICLWHKWIVYPPVPVWLSPVLQVFCYPHSPSLQMAHHSEFEYPPANFHCFYTPACFWKSWTTRPFHWSVLVTFKKKILGLESWMWCFVGPQRQANISCHGKVKPSPHFASMQTIPRCSCKPNLTPNLPTLIQIGISFFKNSKIGQTLAQIGLRIARFALNLVRICRAFCRYKARRSSLDLIKRFWRTFAARWTLHPKRSHPTRGGRWTLGGNNCQL